jgi:hypothetical protein
MRIFRKPRKAQIVFTTLLAAAVLVRVPAGAQQAEADINARIRQEETANSKIMWTMHYLSDVYGPRLTGSPNHKAAADWAVRTMKEWGFDNVGLEPWDFGHPGWVNERASGFITAPVQDSLVFEVLAWTPSTKGVVKGNAFQLVIPRVPAGDEAQTMLNPTQEELTAYFNGVRDQVKGKIVLVNKPAVIPVNFKPAPLRSDDETLRQRYDPNATPSPSPTQRGPRTPPTRPGALSGVELRDQLDKFLLENQVKLRINDSAMDHGEVRAFSNATYDLKKVVPTVVMRNEDYGRIWRLLDDKTPVSLEFNIRNRSFPEGVTSYNVVGELTGTDLKDEVIMLGGHLDSWHSATGATDNAIGCATMMEALRILKALGVQPRRTIRVALWSGEEEGLLGSEAYVKKHFGSFEAQLPGYEKFAGYFNIDSGTGRARGMSVFGPPEAATILRGYLTPFADLGVVGAIATNSRRTGGSDHTSFNAAGLPGIGVNQDPVEYFGTTWHTNLDTYERIVPDDAKNSAIVIAATVYQLAMRDDRLPRFSPTAMPTPVPTPTPSPSPTPVKKP